MLEQVTIEQTILDSAREVFETMIFMDIETTAAADYSVENPLLMGSISFKGALQGCLAICMPMTTAKAIAANMLALENTDNLPERDICDAIGEVANMTMGSIKHRLLPIYPDIQVSIPIVVSGRLLSNSGGDHFTQSQIQAVLDEKHAISFTLLYKQSETN